MPDIGSFTIATTSDRIRKIPDAIIQDNVLLSALKKKGKIEYNKGGTSFKVPVRSSKSNIGGSTTKWGEGAARTTQPFTEITYQWRQYIWRPFINDFDVELNENASEIAKNFDMMKNQLNEVKQDASERFGVHMYGDGSTLSTGDEAGSVPMDGLESIISTSNTYAGQARSGNTWWQANVQAVADPDQDSNSDGVSNLIDGMIKLYNACSAGKGGNANEVSTAVATVKDSPDSCVTTSNLFVTYFNSLQPQARYTDGKGDTLSRLMFNGGVEVTWDTFCTASRLYMLNWDHLAFRCAGSQMITLKKVIEKSQPLGKEFVLTARCQFYSPNPRYQGAVQTSGSGD